MKRILGFTLIEVMIVVALIAVLVSLAVPSYLNWVRKANRTEAQGLLLNWANNQEIWRASNTSYAGTGNIPVPTHPRYAFTVNAGTNTYILTATANSVGGQNNDSERGTLCNAMTVDQLGAKTPPVCWQE